MLIRELRGREGMEVRGEFRALGSQWITASNGSSCLRFGVRDMTGNLRAHGWRDRYQGPNIIEKDAKILVAGRMRQFDGHPILDVERAEVVSGPERNPLLRMTELPCPVAGALEQLCSAAENLTIAPLRAFTFSVLSLPRVLEQFLLVPASAANHHCYSGGLIEHSLQCFFSVRAQPGFPRLDLELGMVAALFHDIGKIRTLRPNMHLTNEGFLLDHDDLTLEVLAPSLLELDAVWPEGASDLRYIWSFLKKKRERPIPRITVVEAVLAADRISAGLDNQSRAFASHPGWHRHGSFAGRHYTRSLMRNRR